MDLEQMTITGETEKIAGTQRDERGNVEERWVRLTKTTGGLTVEAPDDVIVSHARRSGAVLLRWPGAEA